ncbi:unnamed protein product [Closterium sp. NIES-53]
MQGRSSRQTRRPLSASSGADATVQPRVLAVARCQWRVPRQQPSPLAPHVPLVPQAPQAPKGAVGCQPLCSPRARPAARPLQSGRAVHLLPVACYGVRPPNRGCYGRSRKRGWTSSRC